MQNPDPSSERAPLATDLNANPEGKPSGCLIAAVAVAGLLQLSSMAKALISSDTSVTYSIGYVIGGAIVLPLAAIGIACIFRPMRKPTPILIMLLCVWSISTLGTCASRMGDRIEAAADARQLEDLKARAKTIELEIMESDDPSEILRLQRKLADLLEKENPQLSSGASGALELLNGFMGPFREDVIRYTEDAIPALESFDSALDEPSLVALREAKDAIDLLTERAGELRSRAASLQPDLERFLAGSDLPPRRRSEVFAGFNEGFSRRAPLIEEVYRLEQELLKSMGARLGLLVEHWGQWEWETETLVFEEDLAEAYNKLVAESVALADAQNAARRELAELP